MALAPLALMISGCTTVRATVTPGASLAQYRTYTWYSPHDNADLALLQSPMGQTIRDQIAQDLNKRGMAESPHADFMVAYHAVTQDKLDVTGWGYGLGYWGNVDVNQYTEGTIFVDFIDPRTGNVFWRGTVTSVVDHPGNPDLHKVASAVAKLMRKYPVETAAAAPPSHL
jgi:hypothetical protein